jgi:Ca2+-binding EF-hand superfamily protein
VIRPLLTTRFIRPNPSINPPTNLDILLKEIKLSAATRRLSLRERLESESNGHSLPRKKFYTLLRFCGFSFSSADTQALDDAFLLPNDLINIQQFLEIVDPIEPKPIPVEAEDVLNRLKAHLSNHPHSISKYFASFDREQSGLISIAQLISAFKAVNFHCSTAEITVVAEKFGDRKLLNWRDLCSAVEADPPPKEKQGLNCREEPTPEVVEFLQKVNLAVKRCGVSLRSEFLKVDIRKSGLLNAQIFKGVLDSLSVRSTNSEIVVILRPYFRGKTEMIDYETFCEDVERFGKPVEPVKQAVRIEEKEPIGTEKSDRALRLFKAAVGSRRLNGEELFIGHDSGKMGTIPIETFEPATKPLGQFLTDETVKQIERDFRDRRQPEKFNYRKLCAVLGSIIPTQEDIEEVTEQRRQSCGEREGAEQLVVAIKGKLTERRKTVYELFGDVHDDGIPVTQFRNRVSSVGIYLSENDVQKLVWKYRTGTKNEIDWHAFCDDVQHCRPMQLR